MAAMTSDDLASLQARLVGIDSNYASLKDQLQKSNEEIQNHMALINADLQAKIDLLTKMPRSDGDKSLIDRRGLGKPTVFTSKAPTEWPHWSFKFKNFLIM